MSLENDKHEDDPAGTSDQITPAEQREADDSPTFVAALFQPPKPPTPQAKAPEQPKKWRENTKLGLEIGGLLILIAYTVFSCLQWLQIRWTNRLTREALDDNSYSLGQTLAKMQEQADSMNRLAYASEIQAASVTRAESALIAVDEPPTVKMEIGTPLIAVPELVNLGHTLAKQVAAKGRCLLLKMGDESNFTYTDDVSTSRTNTGIVNPTIRHQFPIFATQNRNRLFVSSDQFSEYIHRHTYVLTYGRVDYKDIFGVSHWTTFCNWTEHDIPGEKMDPDSHKRCAEYNSSDANLILTPAPIR